MTFKLLYTVDLNWRNYYFLKLKGKGLKLMEESLLFGISVSLVATLVACKAALIVYIVRTSKTKAGISVKKSV